MFLVSCHWRRTRVIPRTADYAEQSQSRKQEAPTAKAQIHPSVCRTEAGEQQAPHGV